VSTNFAIISEEFYEELHAIRLLVKAFDDPHKGSPRARVAAANSATLLLAATFEEYVREMARTYAKVVVAAATSFEKLPSKLANVAWRRTLEELACIRIDTKKNISSENVFSEALVRFNVIYEFCKGDLSQDIYGELVHNQNNMRPGEINSLFKLSDLGDVCSKLADKKPLLDNFGEIDAGKAHGRLLVSLEEFIERRNKIAHSLSPAQSSGSDQILKDIDMLDAFAQSLCETLES